MINIGNRYIGRKYSTFIIAEAGVNHNGDIEVAKRLIDVAVETGADAVKFQTFNVDDLVTKNAPKAKYQQETTDEKESQYKMLKKLELSKEEHLILKEYCQQKNIIFMSTPFDFSSVDLLEEIGIQAFKVGSGDLTNLPLLEYIAQKNKPIILSTGMSNLGEVEEAVNTILDTGNKDLILLHCVSNYPTEFKDVNLRAIQTLGNAFKLPVGYSDHTPGIEIPIAAVAMGAKVIEKHFTLDKNMEGPDHKASLNPEELKEMVKSIRNVEKSLGDGIKRCMDSEKDTRKVARRSLVAKRDLKAGEVLTEDNIGIKRPGTGIKPKYYNKITGHKINKDIYHDTLFQWEDIEFE